jgi:hypothetical protein
MRLPHRRQFFHLAAGIAAFPAVSPLARAQLYPTRQMRIVVGFTPGGAAAAVRSSVKRYSLLRPGGNRDGALVNFDVYHSGVCSAPR